MGVSGETRAQSSAAGLISACCARRLARPRPQPSTRWWARSTRCARQPGDSATTENCFNKAANRNSRKCRYEARRPQGRHPASIKPRIEIRGNWKAVASELNAPATSIKPRIEIRGNNCHARRRNGHAHTSIKPRIEIRGNMDSF